ncbi:beclin-1-like protein [Drosophila sulfurigaster albostrigata]|uniref:Beclin-1-like protein n=1 Tax=Drosophila albomicans TaxID=7291 RepID=A0A6P8XLG2_DROAB|nr:beclin-1-like protein [Drosophila albomicans]XP_060645438.1 beclin-1-like protein [Drosophila nasuta]XP_062126484.1 beclin-1-like protein [Drosophila sulfurigaster albostrigata]
MTEADKQPASFACQRCLQPIVLDEQLEKISVHAMAELSLPIYGGNVNTIDAQDANSFDHFVPPFRLTDSINGTGFMLVSDGRDNKKLSAAFKLKAELFDCLSSNSEIDHPLCEECADSMLEIMNRELSIAEDEWQVYKTYLNELEQQQEGPNVEALDKELEELKLSEQKLLEELATLKKQEQGLNEEIEQEEIEKQKLHEQEESYWREYTKHRRELMLTEDDKRSLECQIAYSKQQLDKLRDTNIFNITFHIWHAGHFGTINNFRLGRLPSVSVDWSEINAAWGQTVLLLSALARKIGLCFERYRVVPFGNHSYVEVLGDNRELPLYGSGGFKFFWDTKFDAAMVAFLDCLTQFQQEVEKRDTEFLLPYKMEKGKIIDPSTGNSYSIKIQFNSEEQWTKALKFMLTNLKWGLAWVSSQFVTQ